MSAAGVDQLKFIKGENRRESAETGHGRGACDLRSRKMERCLQLAETPRPVASTYQFPMRTFSFVDRNIKDLE